MPTTLTDAQQCAIDGYRRKEGLPALIVALIQEMMLTQNAIAAGSSGPIANPLPVAINQTGLNNAVQIVGGTQRTVSSTDVSAGGGGTIALGAKSITFSFSSDFTGTVNGSDPTLTGQSSKSINAPLNDTLPAIAYTRTAGTVTIDVIR